ncbi:hypothetical protein D3C77_496290 [compost metagenome]
MSGSKVFTGILTEISVPPGLDSPDALSALQDLDRSVLNRLKCCVMDSGTQAAKPVRLVRSMPLSQGFTSMPSERLLYARRSRKSSLS